MMYVFTKMVEANMEEERTLEHKDSPQGAAVDTSACTGLFSSSSPCEDLSWLQRAHRAHRSQRLRGLLWPLQALWLSCLSAL